MHSHTLGCHPQLQEVNQTIPLVHSGDNKYLVGDEAAVKRKIYRGEFNWNWKLFVFVKVRDNDCLAFFSITFYRQKDLSVVDLNAQSYYPEVKFKKKHKNIDKAKYQLFLRSSLNLCKFQLNC